MAKLAINGHATRGKEVIEILEMLGGKNIHNYNGTFNECYVIDNNKICTIYTSVAEIDNHTIFTLEQFEEKYPYKVGDKVKAWVNGYRGVFNIQDITWDSITKKIKYRIHDYWYSVENLQPYKEETMKEKSIPPYMDYDIKENIEKNQPPKTQAEVDKYLQEHSVKNGMNVIDIETCLETDGLKLPENVVINSKGIGSIQFIQWYEKTKYPKTYEECCKILDWNHRDYDRVGYKSDLLCKLQVLLLCRDAYWEIAGEEMGLGKPWKPDWDEEIDKFTISNKCNEIYLNNTAWYVEVLSFPTAEMRDAFYENFKDLIEYCKELL